MARLSVRLIGPAVTHIAEQVGGPFRVSANARASRFCSIRQGQLMRSIFRVQCAQFLRTWFAVPRCRETALRRERMTSSEGPPHGAAARKRPIGRRRARAGHFQKESSAWRKEP